MSIGYSLLVMVCHSSDAPFKLPFTDLLPSLPYTQPEGKPDNKVLYTDMLTASAITRLDKE